MYQPSFQCANSVAFLESSAHHGSLDLDLLLTYEAELSSLPTHYMLAQIRRICE
jgi:hypothetical protein